MPNLIAAPVFGFLISSTAVSTAIAGPLATAIGYAVVAGKSPSTSLLMTGKKK